MFEVTDTRDESGKTIVELTDNTDGRIVEFAFHNNLYSEEALKKKIEMINKTGILSEDAPKLDLAKNLLGKRFNDTKGVFE